jgi:hypothetical protein
MRRLRNSHWLALVVVLGLLPVLCACSRSPKPPTGPPISQTREEAECSGPTSNASTLSVPVRLAPTGTASSPRMKIVLGTATLRLGNGQVRQVSIRRMTATFPEARGFAGIERRGPTAQLNLRPSVDPWAINGPTTLKLRVTWKDRNASEEATAECEVEIQPGSALRALLNCLNPKTGDKVYRVAVDFFRQKNGNWIYVLDKIEEVPGGPPLTDIQWRFARELQHRLHEPLPLQVGRYTKEIPPNQRVQIGLRTKGPAYLDCLTQFVDLGKRRLLTSS